MIDNQVSEWLYNEKMKKYLRPQTLFGTKFESYLNNNKVVNYTFTNDKKEKEYTEEEIAEFEKWKEDFKWE